MKYVDKECTECKYCQEYEYRGSFYLRCVHPQWFRCKHRELFWPRKNEGDKQ